MIWGSSRTGCLGHLLLEGFRKDLGSYGFPDMCRLFDVESHVLPAIDCIKNKGLGCRVV